MFDDPAALPEPLPFVAALELAPVDDDEEDLFVLFPLPRAPDELPPLPPPLPPAPVPAAARGVTADAQTRMMYPPIVRPRASRACVSIPTSRANLSTNPHRLPHLQNHSRSDRPFARERVAPSAFYLSTPVISVISHGRVQTSPHRWHEVRSEHAVVRRDRADGVARASRPPRHLTSTQDRARAVALFVTSESSNPPRCPSGRERAAESEALPRAPYARDAPRRGPQRRRVRMDRYRGNVRG